MKWTKTLFFALLLTSQAKADDWPQWLGPKRDGVWRETGILEKFPKGGPLVRWRVPINPGYTGPAVVGDKIYVMDRIRPKDADGEPVRAKGGVIPGSERVLCLKEADGAILWKDEYECPYKGVQYPQGPRTTPIVRDGKLFTLGAMGDLRCYDALSGKLHWFKSFVNDYKAKPPVWGWSSHLLLDGDRIIALVGGEGSAAVAFQKDTGKELWRSLTAEEVGYSPPMLYEAGGKRQLIVWLDVSVNALDPVTGKLYWTTPYPLTGTPQRPAVTIASPTKAGDHLLVSAFYNGSLMLKFQADKPEVTELWRSKAAVGAKPDTLNAILATPVIQDGYIYGVCGFGELRCLKADTGQQVWESYAATTKKKALFASAFLTPQGNRFFIANDQGDLIIAKLTPKGYEEIDRTHLLETTLTTRGRDVIWSHPAYAHRCAFMRNDKEIICVSLAADNL